MSELRELYQEYVLDHGKNPRNFRYPEGATHTADGYNPLCGDKITVQVRLDGDVIADLGFQGQGCAISTASASTMTEAVKGKTLGEARAYFEKFIAMVKGEEEPDLSSDELETLSVFAGVAEFPMRVKCATLAWHTLTAALEGKAEVSTE
ncbi:MAG: SUF system NifU family Fe-S cluster assembly protein [Sandaracinaceae bacterium]|nr:MAG: SUF system NifU family Fe-S cluster assembly protein [Sandaracinaceae bacterium]